MHETTHLVESGFLLTGFQAFVALWIWTVAALAYGLYRSVLRPDPDPIRPSGPTGV